jgi:hypothetical protein
VRDAGAWPSGHWQRTTRTHVRALALIDNERIYSLALIGTDPDLAGSSCYPSTGSRGAVGEPRANHKLPQAQLARAAPYAARLSSAHVSFRIWRERRVGNGAAQKIKRLLERAIIFLVRRHVRLRARLLVAFALEMATERSLAFDIGVRLQIGGHLLEYLYVGLDALRLD